MEVTQNYLRNTCKIKNAPRENKKYLDFGNMEHSSCSIFSFYSISGSWPPWTSRENLQDIYAHWFTNIVMHSFPVASAQRASAARRYRLQTAGTRDSWGFCSKPSSFQVTHLLFLPLTDTHWKAFLAWQSQGVGGNLPPPPNKEHTWEETNQWKESLYKESKRKFSGGAQRLVW